MGSSLESESLENISELDSSWARFLLDVELAKNFNGPYHLEGISMPNPLLDRLLPTLLFVQLVSLTDETIEAYRVQKKVSFPSKVQHDLYNRIELLKSDLKDPQALHELREKRRELAHSSAFIGWQDLHDAIDRVESEFQYLNLVGTRPEYQFYAQRSKAKGSDDPRYICEWDYEYGLKKDGKVAVRVGWTKRLSKG